MFKDLLSKLAGNPYEREISRYKEIVQEVAAFEPAMQGRSDEELRELTSQFRERLAAGETLDDLLPEAFAAVREASVRTTGLRHFDVQIIGGIVLHEGRISEMKTGEGKTLVATLPLYLNALTGRGVHLVTVNDYLARRDGGWMGKIYHRLGLSVGVIGKEQYSAIYDPEYVDPGGDLQDERLVHWRPVTRRECYLADVTYGTAPEFGFDYLRDNTAIDVRQLVQREHHYAIVDEVDSVLIDSARTPLIISGPAGRPADWYARFAHIVRGMRRNTADLEIDPPNGHYDIEERTRTVTLTEIGIERVEEQLPEINTGAGESIYDPQYYDLVHYLDNALKAEYIFKRDVDYFVGDGRVILIDQTTGRPMPSRRYSEGLHQAIEAKEGVQVQREDVTIATITFQNYFRMYEKLAGMTGTAITQAEEFDEVYELDVIGIPTNVEYMAQEGALDERHDREESVVVTRYFAPDRPDQPAFYRRVDYPDVVYKSIDAKHDAVIQEIMFLHDEQRPVLVGTGSVDASEDISRRLSGRGLKPGRDFNVLNAKQHDKEALIVAQAGQPGAITISTSMAGRGTDILLGGNPEGLAAERVEKLLFTEEDMTRLVERYFEDGSESAGSLAERYGDPALVDWLEAGDQRFRDIVARIEEQGMWQALAQELRAYWQVPFEHITALLRHIAEGRADRAQQMVEEGAIPAAVLADAGNRWVEYGRCRAAYSGESPVEFLSQQLFEAHFNARAALIRAVLADNIEEARAIAEKTPGLPVSLIDEIQAIRRQCGSDRQHIWEAGGLHVLGTERHEARRIDNQLRGRAARQGDPGSSRFYLSLEDELMVRFGGERIKNFMDWANVPDDEPLTANMLTNAIETAQTRFENYYFDIRKNLIEYDEAVNRQRQMVYDERRAILEGQDIDLDRKVREFFEGTFDILIERYGEGFEGWVLSEIQTAIEDFASIETGEVNTRGVLRRVQGLLPPIDPEYASEVAAIEDSDALYEALSGLVDEAIEQGHNARLLLAELTKIAPLWPAMPDVVRSGARDEEAFTGMVRQAFDRLSQPLPEEERATLWQTLSEQIARAFREAVSALRRGDDAQEVRMAFFHTINEALIEASQALLSQLEPEELTGVLLEQVDRLLEAWRSHPEFGIGEEQMREYERILMLSVIDREWHQYLVAVDDLRQGIGLEAFAQRDPKVEFKRRVFEMFDRLREDVRTGVVTGFFRELPRHRQVVEARRREEATLEGLSQSGYRVERGKKGGVTLRKDMWNVGRNDPCPCGSGKKFKNCHLPLMRDQQQTISVDEVRRTSGKRRRRR
jgi:preprotein translocase subunit SecA